MASRRSESHFSRGGGITSGVSPIRLGSALFATALLAVVGHIAGRGTVATSCPLLLSALGASAAATFGAAWVAHRCRGVSGALGILTVGQISIEAILSIPAHHLPAPLPGAIVHGLAVVAAGCLLMGTTRTFRPLVDVVERWLPVIFSSMPPEMPGGAAPACGRRFLGAGLTAGRGPAVPRGPPAPRVALPHF